ncbi:MAG: FtsX-like permease family protein [Ardenticatenia bacterium]|nr:FtsX-like permease family protein [Ardenticatenia bacterium]
MVSTVTVVAGEGQSSAVMGQIQQLLRRRHDIEAGEDDDFNVVSQDDLLSLVGNVTGLFTAFLGVIAVISLVVGGIGIMNIMLVSVTERTREIGIRKAVGARTSDILLQFLFEAIVLSVIGGLMGMGTGIGVSWLITKSGFVTAKVTPFAIVLALTSALTVGVISGVYPARRAAALKPIDALRYE